VKYERYSGLMSRLRFFLRKTSCLPGTVPWHKGIESSAESASQVTLKVPEECSVVSSADILTGEKAYPFKD